MAEDRHASEDELRAIVLGAIAAAPTLTGIQPGVWIAKVNEAIPFVAAMMRKGALPEHDSRQIRNAREVAEAEVFTGVYLAHQIETSSTRVLVEFSSERKDAERESIRSHRTDTSAGKVMLARLDKLNSGDRIVIFKAMEEMSGSQGRKVRTLVHFETLPQRSDTQQAAASGSLRSPAQTPAAQPSPAETTNAGEGDPFHQDDPSATPPRGPSTGDIDASLAARFNDLPTKVKIVVARRLRESDITFPTPQDDKVDAFVAIIAAEERTANG